MLRSRERGGITQIKIFHHIERRARRGAPCALCGENII